MAGATTGAWTDGHRQRARCPRAFDEHPRMGLSDRPSRGPAATTTHRLVGGLVAAELLIPRCRQHREVGSIWRIGLLAPVEPGSATPRRRTCQDVYAATPTTSI